MRDMYGLVLFHLGALYEYHGKITESLEARKECEEYLDSQEKDTRWMLYSGISRNYEAMGEHDKAISYSQKAIQVLGDNDPGLAYLYESMANNYMELRQYQNAIQHFLLILELDPDFVRIDEIREKLADCCRRISNHAQALDVYEKIFKLEQRAAKNKGLIWIRLRFAECHFRMSSYEKSLLAAFEALHQSPRNPREKAEALGYIAVNYYELGRYSEAVRDGEKALKPAQRFPNDDLLYVRMALAFHKLGDGKSFTKYRALVQKMFKDDALNKHLEKLS
jgi:tetratricopeptide (TPR) repeat protein